ncbi:MAG: hypothetical protein ACR2QK_15690 [Acidimicrobiales bacterium]
MAKVGAGAWKDRIDQSGWVDNTPWLDDDDDDKEPDEPVEFLEAEPSAYRLSETRSKEEPGLFSSTSARLVGLGSLAVVLLALALMSRPGDQDPFEQLPPDKQQEIRQRQNGAEVLPAENQGFEQGQTTLTTPLPQPAPTPARPAPLNSDDEGDGAPLGPVPALRADLPPEMPDLLYTYGAAGSVIQIRRADDQPAELELPGAEGLGSMQVSRSDELPLVLTERGLAAVLPAGELETSTIEADQILPADDGIMLVKEAGQTRDLIIPTLLDDGGEVLTVGYDAELLGSWQNRPLIHKAGTVWLIDGTGGAQPVTDGAVVSYDGQYLVMVRCASPDDCRIEAGPPDRPGLRSVPVPDDLTGRDVSSWTDSVAVSRDGSRLAVVDRRGVSLPTWIDLDTGVDVTRSESVNRDSPVAWSPDGLWVAYAFDDDLIVWDTEANQSWRIFVDRPISHLAWTEDLG